jgi:hypothetical protein
VVQTLSEHADVLIPQRLLILWLLPIKESIRVPPPTLTHKLPIAARSLRPTKAHFHIIPVADVNLGVVECEAVFVVANGLAGEVRGEGVAVALVPGAALVGGRDGGAQETLPAYHVSMCYMLFAKGHCLHDLVAAPLRVHDTDLHLLDLGTRVIVGEDAHVEGGGVLNAGNTIWGTKSTDGVAHSVVVLS